MLRVVDVRTRAPYTLWLRFADGVQGEVDLSHLSGRGVFSVWQEPGRFARVAIDEFGALSWGDGVEIDPDSLYLTLTGKSPADVFRGLRSEPVSTGTK